jgi:hypothetical protein
MSARPQREPLSPLMREIAEIRAQRDVAINHAGNCAIKNIIAMSSVSIS